MTPALLALILAAAPPQIANAQVTTRSAAAGLVQAVEAALRGNPSAQWIGYAVPVEGRHQMCCWGDSPSSRANGCCGRCRLEEGHGFTMGREDSSTQLESDGTGLVLLRAEQGRVGKIRMFSHGCAIDAGGLPFVWLTDVVPAQSLGLLAPYADRGDEAGRKHLSDGALAAIAFHADAAADDLLHTFTRPPRREHLRKQAAFWLGNARGRRGYLILAGMMRDDPSDEVRAHVTFALSQSEVPEALTEMLRAARHDPSGRVRGQALFWLAQKAGKKASSTIKGAIDNDPDTNVKEIGRAHV